MTQKSLRILQLYPRDMNIYGDWGNTLTVLRRAERHGISAEVIDYNPGDEFPKDIDIVIGGGGQDSGQLKIQDDLQQLAPTLRELAEDNVPMLAICGLYQLFGHFFKTKDGDMIKGIGILDIETYGSNERLIGNIITHSERFGDIVGYENHSGLTYLADTTQLLGTVTKGAGNNGKDHTEGACFNNVIGTYLHGSLLPKNPVIADWLIEQACMRKYGEFTPADIDDSLAQHARETAMNRPR